MYEAQLANDAFDRAGSRSLAAVAHPERTPAELPLADQRRRAYSVST
jgi:hypothetical protein